MDFADMKPGSAGARSASTSPRRLHSPPWQPRFGRVELWVENKGGALATSANVVLA